MDMDDERLRAMLERIEDKLNAALEYRGRSLLHPAKMIAKALGISVRTLHRWRNDIENPLLCVHIGSGLATTPSMIDAWVERRYELEQRRERSLPRTRQYDRIKEKIAARVPLEDDEGEGSDVASRDFPIDSASSMP